MGAPPPPELKRLRKKRGAAARGDAIGARENAAGDTARPDPRGWRRLRAPRTLQLLLVAALAFGVYANTLTNAFVNDDEHQVLMNPWIQDVGKVPTIFSSSVWAFVHSRTTTDYYRPMMHLVYLVNFQLFGFQAWGFHLVNALLHAANTALLFLVAGLWVRAGPERGPGAPFSPPASRVWMPVPLIAALLFATHPIHTEAVAWIASVPDLTLTLFGLAALAFYIQEAARPQPRWWPSWVCFCLALLCKETAVTLVGVFAAFDLLLGRSRRTPGALARRWLPYVVTVAVYLIVRHQVLDSTLVRRGSLWDLSPIQLALSALDLFRQYLWALLLPVDLNFWHTFQPVESLFSLGALSALAVVAAFAVVCWWAWRFDRTVAFGLALLVLPLAPAFYIAALPAKPFAERYLYLPSAGFVLVTALLLARLAALPHMRLAVSGLVLAVTTLLAVVTVQRNEVWTDALTLYTDSAAKSARVPTPPISLAAELLKRGHHREAIAQFRILAQVEPRNAAYLSALGNALLLDGQTSEALERLRAAVALDPKSLETLNDLAIAVRREGNATEAIGLYRQALAIDSSYVEAHFNLGGALADSGDVPGALEHYRAAVRLRPENAYYRSVLGIELARHNDRAGALVQFEEAARLDPEEPAYQKNLERARGLATTPATPAAAATAPAPR